MDVFSLCLFLLWSCWQSNSLVHASFMDLGLPSARDPRVTMDRQVTEFALRLDEMTLKEQDRFHRSLGSLRGNRMRREAHHGNRVRRDAVTDFRHGFYPGTGVGNREDFVISSVELISNSSVLNGSVIEWGYLKMEDNGGIVTAMMDEELMVYRLSLDDPDEPLSLMQYFSDVLSSEVFERNSWQGGQIVSKKQYVTIHDSTRFLTHYKVFEKNLTLQTSVDLGPLSVVDMHDFAFDKATYLGVLTGNGFLRLYRWSSRCEFVGGAMVADGEAWHEECTRCSRWFMSTLKSDCRFSVAEDLSVPIPVSNLQAFDIYGRHYILVSATETNSTIFKYHSRQNSFRQYQRLFPEGAKQAMFFTDAYDHYLVFIDAFGLTSTFFKWNGIEFTQVQVMDTVGANHWHAVDVPGTQDGALLILSSDGSPPDTKPLTLYKHDPITDTFQIMNESSVIAALNPPEYINASSTLSFHDGDDVYLLVGVSKRSSDDEPGNLFKISFVTTETDDPVVTESLELEAKIKQLENEVSRLNDTLDAAAQNISDSVTKNGTETIRGNKVFNKVDAEIVHADHIDVKDAYIYAPRPTGNESLSHLVNQSKIQQEQIQSLQELLSDAVYLNTTQTITGPKIVLNMTIEGALNSTVFSTDTFDGVDIDELNNLAFRLNIPNQVINGGLVFNKNLITTMSIHLDDGHLVNGVDLSVVAVLTHGAQLILGRKILQQDTVIHDNMTLGQEALLNGINPSDLVTLTGSHVITGQLNFVDVIHIFGDIVTSGNIDGVDAGSLCIDKLTMSDDQEVLGPLTFQQPAVFETDLEYGGLVSGVNITYLADMAVRINEDTVVTGNKSFSDVSVTGDVFVSGSFGDDNLMNNVNLPSDVVQLSVGGTISGDRVFMGNVTVSGPLTTDGNVNGLDLSQDVVTLKGNHTVQGKLHFTSGLIAAEISSVTGNVDTVDVSAWASSVMTLSTDQTVQGPIVFSQDTKMLGNLTVDGLINSIDLLAMYRDTFFKWSSQEQIIIGNKTFTEPLTVTSGQIVIEGLINGYNMTADFLDKYSDQTITGSKTFVDGFAADAGLNVSGLIATIDLEALYANSLIKGRRANLIGERTFLGDVKVMDAVYIAGTIDGIKMATDVLTTNGNQVVTGLKTFLQLEAFNMSCVDVDIEVTVNGRNWTEFVLGRIDLTSDQEISVNHTLSTTAVANNVDIKWLVNTVSLTPAMLNDIMSKTIVQTVSGCKNITDTFIVHGNVSLGDHINGISLYEFAARAILLDGPEQTITGSKSFADMATLSDHLELTGLLDGVDLDFFMSDIIFPDNLRKISGTKTFLSGFFAGGNINVSGTVDGVDISEDVMTTNTDQNLPGSFIVVDNIVTTAVNTIVSGLINGIDLVELNNTILKTNEDQTIDSPLVFLKYLTSTTDVTVTGHVDGVDLSEFKSQSSVLDQPFNLTGNLTFLQGVTFQGPTTFEGLINRKNLSAWYQDVVLLHTNEDVLGNKTFLDDITVAGVMRVVDDMEVDRAFSKHFDTFVNDAVNLTMDVTISGRKTFEGDIDALADVIVHNKTIDGIYIKDIVTLDGDEVISGMKTFTQNMTVNGHIFVSELVNGVDISDIYNRTFKLDSPQNVTAHQDFAQNVTATKNIYVSGLVDTVDLDVEAVTLGTDQVIEGAISFNVLVTANGNVEVDGYVGGVNLTNLVTDRATLLGSETIRGVLTFLGHVTFQDNVTVLGLFDGVSLPYLWDLQTELLLWVRIDIENLLWISADQCLSVEQLQSSYANTVEDLAHVSEIQEINLRMKSSEAFLLDGVSHLALAIHSNMLADLCVDSYIYVWNDTRNEFVEKAAIGTNGALSWHAFKRRETQYLAVANSGTNPCSGVANVTNTIYVYDGSDFVVHQEISSDETIEMDSVIIEGDVYLALANLLTTAQSTVYRQAPNGLFYLMQNFTIGGAMDVEFVQVRNTTLLVFAAIDPTQSPVYMFNSETGQFDFHQYIASSYASAIDSYKYHGSTGIAIANHAQIYDNDEISYNVPIEVFFWSETNWQFELFEMVDFTAAVDVKMFHIGPDLYLAAISQYENLQIYRHEGLVGFSLVLTLASYGAVSVEVFEVPDLPSNMNLFFALAIDPNSQDDVSARILQEKVIGQGVRFENLPCSVAVEDIFHGDPRLLD